MSQPNRRDFLKAGVAVVPAAALARGAKAPSEKINLGIIGANGMGSANLHNCAVHPDVVVTAVCDVHAGRREAAVNRHKATAKGYADWRELLARDDVDAVIIATPPHWHALMAVEAAKAGKDIYLQKPMTLYPAETLAVRNAVNRHKVICQVGTQIHATANYRRCVEWVRSGKLGPISVVRTFNVMNEGAKGIGKAAPAAPPAGFDWNMWLGPGPQREYNSSLVRDAFAHCWFMDYSGGWTPGMAPHIIDLPIWALDLGVPEVTYCSGQRIIADQDGDAPDIQEVTWQYPGVTLHWSMSTVNSYAWDFGKGKPSRRLGIYFHGLNGTLVADYGRCEIVPEGDLLKDLAAPPQTIAPSPGHEREWLNCIKTRTEPSCSPNYHQKLDLAINLANLSYKLGRALHWDAKAETIVGDAEAAKRMVPVYREPWKFPSEYLVG